jgi:hypothetical protein
MLEQGERSHSWIIEAKPIPTPTLSGVVCPLCATPVCIHQPDLTLPERLLLTCDGCQHWHVIELDPEGGRAMMITLRSPAAADLPQRGVSSG